MRQDDSFSGFTGTTGGKLSRVRSKLGLSKNFHTGDDIMTKDPVCGMNVDENNSQYRSEHNGKQYSFCSEQCKTSSISIRSSMRDRLLR